MLFRSRRNIRVPPTLMERSTRSLFLTTPFLALLSHRGLRDLKPHHPTLLLQHQGLGVVAIVLSILLRLESLASTVASLAITQVSALLSRHHRELLLSLLQRRLPRLLHLTMVILTTSLLMVSRRILVSSWVRFESMIFLLKCYLILEHRIHSYPEILLNGTTYHLKICILQWWLIHQALNGRPSGLLQMSKLL